MGVSYDKSTKRYKARITIEGETHSLGNYSTEDDALIAVTACKTARDPLSYVLNLKKSAAWGKRKYSADWQVSHSLFTRR
jgi:hypothetical protein